MPDNNLITIKFDDGVTEKWTPEQYEQAKDRLYEQYPKAKAIRTSLYDPRKGLDSSDAFDVQFSDGYVERWDADQLGQAYDKLIQADPDAQVYQHSDLRYQYWQPKAEEAKRKLDEFNAQNHEFMVAYETSKARINEAAANGYVDSKAVDFEAENNGKYLPLYQQREQLRKDYFTNPLVQDMYERNAQQAAERSEYYKQQAKEAGERSSRKDWQRAAKIQDDIRKMYEAPDKYIEEIDGINGFANYMMDFSKGAVDKFSDKDFYTFGLSAIARNFDLRGIAKKIEEANAESDADIDSILTESEKAQIMSFYNYAEAQRERAETITGAYRSGQTAAESVKFMAEFLLSQGFANVAGKAMAGTENAVVSWLGRQLMSSQALARAAGQPTLQGVKIAADVAKDAAKPLAARILTTAGAKPIIQGIWHTLSQVSTLETISNELMNVGENGQLVSGWRAFGEGMLDSVIENWSESLGAAAESLIAPKFGDKTSLGRFFRWLNESGSAKVLGDAGFNGLIGEMAEEWAGNAVRLGLGLMSKEDFKDFASWEQQLEMAASFAPMTLIGMSTATASALRKSGQYKELSGKVKDILERQKVSEDEINNLFNTNFDTFEDVGKKLAPYLREISAKAKVQGATQQEKDDYKTMMNFAELLGRQIVLDEMHNQEQADKRQAVRTDMQNIMGRFWQEPQPVTEGETPQPETVRVVTGKDGQTYYVLDENADGRMSAVTPDGKHEFINKDDIAEDNTYGMDDFLQQQSDAIAKSEELQRMNAERLEQVNAVRRQIAQKPVVPVGTEAQPIDAAVVDRNNDGVRIQYTDAEGQPQDKWISWYDVAAYLGTPIDVKTDAQLEEEAARELDEARKRVETYNKIPKGTKMTVMLEDGDGNMQPVTVKFQGAVLDDGAVLFYGQDEQGNSAQYTEDMVANKQEMVDNTAIDEGNPFKSGVSVAYQDNDGKVMRGVVSEADNGGGFTTVRLPDGTVANVETARLSAYDESQVEQTPAVDKYTNEQGKVNQTAFMNKEPKEWAIWNDAQRGDGGADSKQRLVANLAVLNEKLNKLNAQLAAEVNPDEAENIRGKISDLQERMKGFQEAIEIYDVFGFGEEEAQAEAPAAEQQGIPADNKGVKQYTQAPARTTYEDIYNDEAFENADEAYGFIAGKVARSKENVDKAQKALDNVAKQNRAGKYATTADFAAAKNKATATMQAAQQELAYWNSVKALADADIARAEKIAKMRENEMYEPKTLLELVADAFIGFRNKLNKESFKKETGYSDADLKPFFQLWAKKGQGLTVDGMAHSIAENDTMNLVPIDDNGLKDVSAVKDAILEVFQQAKSPSDLYDYTYNANMDRQQAEAEYVEQQVAAAEEAAAEAEVPAEVAEQPVTEGEPVNVQPEMEKDEIAPVGKNRFGNIFEQFRGKVKEAFEFLIRRQEGYLRGVFHREDLGDIDLAWGAAPTKYTGYGLSHIIKKHIETLGDFASLEDAERIIADVIENGAAEQAQNDPELIYIQKGDYRVVIANNEEGNWVLTAFDYVNSAKQKEKNKEKKEDTAAIGTPGQSDVEAGAVTSNLPFSDTKGTENSETASVSQENVAEQGSFNFEAEPEAAQQEEAAPVEQQPVRPTVNPVHPDTLRKAYESGDAAQIAAAEKAMAEYIGSSDSMVLLKGTQKQAKNRMLTEKGKKDSAEYKAQDFIAKAVEKRIKELDKILPQINGMVASKAYDAAHKTYDKRWKASEDALRQAIAYYEQELAQAQQALDAVGEDAERLSEEGDLYVNGLKGRILSANTVINGLRQSLEAEESKRNSEIQDRIAKWKELLGDVFTVLTDMQDLYDLNDAGIREAVARELAMGNSVEGWYVTESGQAYIFLPGIKDTKTLDRKVIHEVLAHKGLRNLMGEERYNKYLDNVWDKLMNEEQRQWGLAYNSHLSGKSEEEMRRAAADEFVAHVAENDESIAALVDANTWDKIMEFVKNFINDMLGADVLGDGDTWFHEDLLNAVKAFRSTAKQAQETADADAKREDIIDEVTGGQSKALSTAKAEKNPQVPISQAQEKYEDFGEKIGMARKDIAEKGGKKGDGDSRPAWMKKYKTMNVERVTDAVMEEARRLGIMTDGYIPAPEDIIKGTDFSKPFVGYYEEKHKTWSGTQVRKRYIVGENRRPIVFTSREQFEATVPVFEAKDQKYTVISRDGKYLIVRRASNNKLVEYAQFDTKEEAVAYLASPEGATELLNRKRENFELPALDRVTRINMPDYRNGKNITPDDILNTFGFRGGEFGNWLNADERQQFLNYAYDALMDLANVLGVTPMALSLNGELSIAFGARGKGGSGAAAHYEPTRAVINLTKMYGAGSLAHEWAHALDNYFGLMDAKRERIRDEKQGDNNRKYLSEGQSYRQGARKEVIDAFREVMSALQKKTVTRQIELEAAKEELEKKQHSWDSWYVKNDRQDFARGRTKYEYNRKTKQREAVTYKPTEEQLAEFDRLVALLPNDPTFNWQYEPTKNGWRASGEVAEKLYELVKDVMPNRAGQYGPLHNLFYFTPRLRTAMQRYADAEAGKTETVTVDTDFARESKWFDKDRAGDYWSKDLEMFARAFETYVADRMRDQEQTSDYLAYMKGPLYKQMWEHSPYPEGEELAVAKAAFDKLFDTIQEKTENGKTMLFSKFRPKGWTSSDERALRDKSNNWTLKDVRPYRYDYVGNFFVVFDNMARKEGAYAHDLNEIDIIFATKVDGHEDEIETIKQIYNNDTFNTGETFDTLFEEEWRRRGNGYINTGDAWKKRGSNGLSAVLHRKGASNNRGDSKRHDSSGEKPVKRGSQWLYQSRNISAVDSDSNEGTDKNNPLFSKSNDNQRTFISNAKAAVEAIPMGKATPQQWLKMIESKGGLKAGEDKWIGLSDWLKEQDAKTLTKDDVLGYIHEHQIQIEEVHYGEQGDMEDNEALQSYMDEYYELARSGQHDRAWDEMIDRYGDDFALAFEWNGDGIMPQLDLFDELTDAAREFIEKRRGETATRAIPEIRQRYTTEGLDNKAEIALTIPTIEPYNESDRTHFGDAGEGRAVVWMRFGDTTTFSERGKLEDKVGAARHAVQTAIPGMGNEKAELEAAEKELEEYDKAHPNDTNNNTKRVLFIDEIQSKRHQDARERGGYEGTPVQKQAEAEYEAAKKEVDDYLKSIFGDEYVDGVVSKEYLDAHPLTQEQQDKIGDLNYKVSVARRKVEEVEEKGGIPAAPFEKNWHELAMKRMLRYAAENGYDYVAWTTGEQQAERYNIGNVVEDVDRRDGKVYIDLKDGSAITLKVHKDGQIYESTGAHIEAGEYNGKNLSDLIGKELAQKVLEAKEDQTFRGDALRIGAEGMQGFYDQMLPRFMDKYGKKWGVKTEDMQFPNLEGGITAHAVPVTEEMKESVMQGQLMFSKSTMTTQAGSAISFESMGGLPAGAEHESVVERTYRKSGAFSFMGKNKIETAGDVAYIFKELETAATENSFVVYVKDGVPTILHTGIGNAHKTFLDEAAFVAGMKDFAPDEVFMVHNHPSGNVVASMADVGEIELLQRAAGDIPVYGVIIDTLSGEYGQFTSEDATLIASRNKNDEGDTSLDVHTFDKLVFSENYRSASKQRPITGPEDIASYLSAHRLGNGSKVGALMVDRYNRVVGNLVLNESIITIDNAEQLAESVANVAIHNASENVVLFGDFDYEAGILRHFANCLIKASAKSVSLMDVVRVEGNRTQSLHEGTLQESRMRFSKQAAEQVDKGGISAVVGEDNVRDFYGDIHKAMPAALRKQYVEAALDKDLNFREALERRLSEIAYNGYENDDTGILRMAGDMLRYYTEGDIDDATARYILWRNGAPNDMLADIQAAALKRRWGVGEETDVRFSKSDTEEKIDEADKAAEATVDEAKETLDKGRKELKDLLTAARAMRLQREYDKTTVEAVANLAKQLLKDQSIDQMSRYEVSRLLGLVRTSVGRSPKIVKKNADTIVGIVIDRLVKREMDALDALTSKTGTKVNATGVVVQGELDIRGQQIMKAYKEGLKQDVGNTDDSEDENTLYGMRAGLQKSLASKDDAVRAEAEAVDTGLALAIEYKENVKEIMDNSKSLEAEKKDLEQAYKDGDISKTNYYEALDALESAMRENDIELIDAIRSFREKMQGEVVKSVEGRKSFMEREKARIDEIHHLANSDMQGRSASHEKKKETTTADKLADLANNSLVRFFAAPLGTFDQMLRLFGEKSISGEGYLWNKFVRGWTEAREAEIKGMREAKDILDKKVSEVFGKEMIWSDLYKMERDMPKATVKWWDGENMTDHELTQGQLLYIVMVDRMSDGRMKLRRMGISEADVQAIRRQMDDRFLTLADWLQNDYLVNLRNKYNAVHERLFGASMAAIEDYFPLIINKRDLNRNEDVARDDDYESLPTTTTGAIIKRKRNSKALDLLNADAFSVVVEHVEQMERWAAFAEFNKDINALLSYKRFRNQVQNMTTVYGSGDTLWSNVKDVMRIAGNVYRPKTGTFDTAAVNVAKGVTAAKITGRVYTALKQMLSLPAFVADANIVNLAKNMATPWKAWNWAMENLPIFEERWKSRIAGDTRLMSTELDWKFLRGQAYDTLTRLGMTPNAFVDAVTIAIGARSMYETRYAQYIKDGYSEEQADKRAKQDATILYNETQQSNENAFVSAVQLDRTVFSTGTTVFRNSSMGFQRQLHDAVRNIGKHMKQGYREESIAFMTKQGVRDGLSEEQAQAAAERKYNRSLWRDATRVATFGFLVQFAWNLGDSILYLLFGNDDEEKQAELFDAFRHALIGGAMEGLAGGNVMSEALNMIAKGENLRDYDPSLMPIFQDMKRIYSMMGYDPVAGANELINLLFQVGIGVNPQTLEDAVVAVVDACDGDMSTSREAMLLMMRVLQVPQSQLDQIYIDELGNSARNARSMSASQMAKRYADYKLMRGAGKFTPLYSDELADKRKQSYEKRFKKLVKERKEKKK